jgi:hypothetical protein
MPIYLDRRSVVCTGVIIGADVLLCVIMREGIATAIDKVLCGHIMKVNAELGLKIILSSDLVQVSLQGGRWFLRKAVNNGLLGVIVQMNPGSTLFSGKALPYVPRKHRATDVAASRGALLVPVDFEVSHQCPDIARCTVGVGVVVSIIHVVLVDCSRLDLVGVS